VNFLELGGFSHLYHILMSRPHDEMLETEHSKCLGILLNVVKLFMQAALFTIENENLH